MRFSLRTSWRWVSLLLVLGVSCAAVRFLPEREWIKAAAYLLRGYGAVGIFLFIVAYALATVALVPGSLFTIAAGLVYGRIVGTAVASGGATIGAGLAFLASRYLFRRSVERLAARKSKVAALDAAIRRYQWKAVGIIRLTPFVPFNLSNYFFGITAIRFWPYLLTSWVAMLPGAAFYACLGEKGQQILDGGELSIDAWRGIGLRIFVFLIFAFVANRALWRILGKFREKNGKDDRL